MKYSTTMDKFLAMAFFRLARDVTRAQRDPIIYTFTGRYLEMSAAGPQRELFVRFPLTDTTPFPDRMDRYGIIHCDNNFGTTGKHEFRVSRSSMSKCNDVYLDDRYLGSGAHDTQVREHELIKSLATEWFCDIPQHNVVYTIKSARYQKIRKFLRSLSDLNNVSSARYNRTRLSTQNHPDAVQHIRFIDPLSSSRIRIRLRSGQEESTPGVSHTLHCDHVRDWFMALPSQRDTVFKMLIDGVIFLASHSGADMYNRVHKVASSKK